MRNIIKALKDFLLCSYHIFYILITLNLLFIAILAGITALSMNLFPQKILINKNAIIKLNSINQEKSITMIISTINNNKNNPLIILTDKNKKEKIIKAIKKNRISILTPSDYFFIGHLSSYKENNIKSRYFSANIKPRYLNKDTIVVFELKKNITKTKILIVIPLILLFLIILSLTIPTSDLIRQNITSNETKIFLFFLYWRKNWLKSIIINLLFIIFLSTIYFNINYLRQFESPVFAFLFVVNIWLIIFVFLAYLWTIPISSYFPKDGLFKILKKIILFTLDNIFITIIIATVILGFIFFIGYILTLFLTIYSLILLLVFPGISGLLLFLNINFKYIFQKYDN